MEEPYFLSNQYAGRTYYRFPKRQEDGESKRRVVMTRECKGVFLLRLVGLRRRFLKLILIKDLFEYLEPVVLLDKF